MFPSPAGSCFWFPLPSYPVLYILEAKNQEGVGGKKWAVDAKALLCTLHLSELTAWIDWAEPGSRVGEGAYSTDAF